MTRDPRAYEAGQRVGRIIGIVSVSLLGLVVVALLVRAGLALFGVLPW